MGVRRSTDEQLQKMAEQISVPNGETAGGIGGRTTSSAKRTALSQNMWLSYHVDNVQKSCFDLLPVGVKVDCLDIDPMSFVLILQIKVLFYCGI